MKSLIVLTAFILVYPILNSCGGGPQPIRFGEDACDNCRMVISDKRFGAELVTAKGKVFKFDDINCFWKYKQRQKMTEADLSFQMVVAYNQPGQLIEATTACILRSDAIKSPMSSRMAAFSPDKDCNKMEQKWKASKHNWSATEALVD